MSDAPKHTYEVTLNVGGPDWERVAREIERLADHVRKHGPVCNLAGGGGGVGYYVVVEHYPDVTEDSHAKALVEWLERQRAERRDLPEVTT